MRFVVIIACLCLVVASPVFAQQQRTFTLQVNEADIAVIGQGLENLPYKVAAPVIAKLQAQIGEQVKQAPPPRMEQK